MAIFSCLLNLDGSTVGACDASDGNRQEMPCASSNALRRAFSARRVTISLASIIAGNGFVHLRLESGIVFLRHYLDPGFIASSRDDAYGPGDSTRWPACANG